MLSPVTRSFSLAAPNPAINEHSSDNAFATFEKVLYSVESEELKYPTKIPRLLLSTIFFASSRFLNSSTGSFRSSSTYLKIYKKMKLKYKTYFLKSEGLLFPLYSFFISIPFRKTLIVGYFEILYF